MGIESHQAAIAEIERLGGKICVRLSPQDDSGPSRLITVDFTEAQITDSDLRHLAGLIGLVCLYLTDTQVTDDGLGPVPKQNPYFQDLSIIA